MADADRRMASPHNAHSKNQRQVKRLLPIDPGGDLSQFIRTTFIFPFIPLTHESPPSSSPSRRCQRHPPPNHHHHAHFHCRCCCCRALASWVRSMYHDTNVKRVQIRWLALSSPDGGRLIEPRQTEAVKRQVTRRSPPTRHHPRPPDSTSIPRPSLVTASIQAAITV